MHVTDLRRFLGITDGAPAPARRLAGQLSRLVRAATAPDGEPWVSAVACMRRPGRRPCPGAVEVLRGDGLDPAIEWRCGACGDEGEIRIG